MERLLKIVEGPMKGAEIALVAGTRVKVGRGEDCDIVIADASLSEMAFELDVVDSAVTLIAADGTAREMRPFEVHVFGTTGVALGPAEGEWEELRPAEREVPPEPSPDVDRPPVAPTDEGTAESPEPEKKGHGCGIGCLGVILLILIVLALAWFFRSSLVERFPQLRSCVDKVESMVRGSPSTARNGQKTAPAPTSAMSLKALAEQHGVQYAERDGIPVLTGNLAHRSERLAIRALALADDRRCILELTDDETLASSADALLFSVTEGALKLASASNRVVVISGYAPTAAALGAALKALRADVPWTGEVDVAAVRVGGPVPLEQTNSSFAVSGVLSGGQSGQTAISGAEALAVDAAGKSGSASADGESADIKISDVNGRKLPRNMFPVAGILTRPYPCVVLRDGHRIVEGGQLGEYTVVRIGADTLELKLGDGKADWEP